MRNLVSFCLNRPVTTIMLYLGLAIFGVMAGLSMDQAFLPDIPVPKLLISAAYPGMPPAEVRELISIPLEDTLSSLRGIRHISSLSRQGSSILTLEFQWGRDMVLAAAETRELLDAAYALLPAGAEKPAILPVDPGDKPVLCFGIFPLKGDLAAARRLCELEIKTRLQQVEGVGMVGLSGGVEEEMQVLVDQQRAVSAGVSLGYISSVLTASAVSMPAGILKEGTVQYIVKTDGRISDAAALAGLLIPLPDGSLIPLGDLAEVRLALRDQESCFLVDAEEGIGLTVHGQKGYSPVRLAAGVREELDAVRKIYSGNLSITPVYDQSGVISASLKNLLFSLLIGAAAAFFIILVFMKNLFPALIITASFPSSVFFCLFFLYVTGRSLNIMSLGGLVLGIGMVVDNSIVVSDNIRESLAGSADIKNSIAGAASEMAASTFGSTVTTLIVFLPVLFLPGVMGALFTDLALSVIFSLLGSFLCSVTLVPVLFLMFAGRHIKRKGAGIFNARNPSRRGLIENIYSRILKGFLRKPLLVLLPVLLVCGAGFFGFERLHFELMPKLSSGELNITVALPPEEPMVLVKQKAADLQHALLSSGAVEMVWARSGGGAGDAYYQADETMRMGVISMTARLRSDQPDNARAGEAVRSLLDVSSLHSEVHKPQDLLDPLFGSLAGLRAAVAGKNPEEALARALDLKVRMEDFAVAAFPENRGAAAVKIFPDSGMSSIYLRPERDILARAGAGFAGVASEIRTALEGTVSFRMERGGRDLDVRVLVNDAQAGSLRRLEDLPLLPEPGSALRLGETGKLTLESSPHSLLREGRKDIVLTEAVTVETMRGLQAGWRALVRGTGYAELTSDSVLKEQKTGILLSFCLAFLLIYLFLSAQFESFSEPLLIFLVLPPGAGGLTAALALSRSSINLYSSLGVIVLLGLSVNTSIILFMHYKNISAVGAGRACPAAVVLRGSVRRLKPILMTMLTTILALLPVAVDPARRSAQSGMAAAVIGGLLFSTAFTVFTLPLVYLGANRLKNRFRKGQT